MKKFESTYERITRESRAEGEARGEARGEAKGVTKGRIAILLRLLDKRFGALPAAIIRRIHSATDADLDQWSERILDARILDDVFAR